MKVLHVSWDLGEGGAQVYLLGLLRELRDHPDLKLSVLVVHERGPLSTLMEQVCDDVTHLSMQGTRDLLGVFRLARYLTQMKVDLVHFHFSNTAFHALMQFLQIPIVYTEHGGGLLAGRFADRMLYKCFSKPIKKFIAISDYMAKVMITENRAIENRVQTVYNGVPIDQIENISPVVRADITELQDNTDHLVGFVGRLVHQKGVEYFIETANSILEKRNDVCFIIIGSGPEETKLKAKVNQLGISSRVVFLGYKKDAVRYMKLFDLLLFTSRFEPFGLVLTEAMAAHVPLVAMDIRGAVSEIIRTGEDGIVIDGPDCESAASAVCQLLSDPDYCELLARNASARVKDQFALTDNANSVYSIYKELVPVQ